MDRIANKWCLTTVLIRCTEQTNTVRSTMCQHLALSELQAAKCTMHIHQRAGCLALVASVCCTASIFYALERH